MDCWNCEKNIDRQVSFEVITKEGIARVCKDCFERNDFPILNKKKTEIIPQNIYSKKRYEEIKKENPLLKKQEQELKEIVSKNYSSKISKKIPEDLVENFHWIIMRSRRSKKLTQGQFAEKIKESETAIKMIEKGILPEKYDELIKKIENFLGIRLFKKRVESFEKEVEETKENLVKKANSGKLKFDDIISRTLTVDDLKKMKKEKESSILGEEKNFILQKEPSDEKPEFIQKKDLTDKEIDDIIFGRN